MVLKLFSVFDSVSDEVVDFAPAVNASAFIRSKLPSLVARYALNDITLYEIGEIDLKANSVISTCLVKHDWNEYKFPETRAEALSKLEIEEITHKKEDK